MCILFETKGIPPLSDFPYFDIFRWLSKRIPLMHQLVHVNPKMRGILVDWLVSVQQKYKLKAETLFLTVQLIDRYSSALKRSWPLSIQSPFVGNQYRDWMFNMSFDIKEKYNESGHLEC